MVCSPWLASHVQQHAVLDVPREDLHELWVQTRTPDRQRMPNEPQRRIAQVLQFTLPGAPNLYYGSEVGMTGAGDPEMRAAMRWDLVADAHPALAWTMQLIQVRKQCRALRVGNFRLAEATRLLAFERYTDRAADTVFVIVNNTAAAAQIVYIILVRRF